MVCLSVCLSVCLMVTFVSPVKTVEPFEMPFGGPTGVGSTNRVLDGWLRCTVVERRSLDGELSLFHARPAAGW